MKARRKLFFLSFLMAFVFSGCTESPLSLDVSESSVASGSEDYPAHERTYEPAEDALYKQFGEYQSSVQYSSAAASDWQLVYYGTVPSMRTISVGKYGSLWGTDIYDHIYEWTGSSWYEPNTSSRLRRLGVGNQTTIWGTNSSYNIYKRTGFPVGYWSKQVGALDQVDAADDGTVWGKNDSGNIYKWMGSSWQQQTGSDAVYISAGNSTNIWIINDNGRLYEWTGSGWTNHGRHAMQVGSTTIYVSYASIAATDSGDLYATTFSFQDPNATQFYNPGVIKRVGSGWVSLDRPDGPCVCTGSNCSSSCEYDQSTNGIVFSEVTADGSYLYGLKRSGSYIYKWTGSM